MDTPDSHPPTGEHSVWLLTFTAAADAAVDLRQWPTTTVHATAAGARRFIAATALSHGIAADPDVAEETVRPSGTARGRIGAGGVGWIMQELTLHS